MVAIIAYLQSLGLPPQAPVKAPVSDQVAASAAR